MCAFYSLVEHGTIYRSRDFPEQAGMFSCLYLPDSAFDSLCRFITTQAIDPALAYGVWRGCEQIRLRNYVGILQTPEGVYLEILPKISLTSAGNEVEPARDTLIKMLGRLRNSPFRRLIAARLKAARLPLWEVFLAAFLDEAQTLMAEGLQSTFVTQDVERPFLRGKWRVAEQLRQPLPRPDRLALRLTLRLADTPPNRLLKTTLTLAARQTQQSASRQLARKLLTALADVPGSDDPMADLRTAHQAGRLYDRYRAVLDWADMLLTGRVPGVSVGQRVGLSLLFPMERVFEDYVSAGFRQYGAGVSVQELSAHLVEQHHDGPRFGLRPDLLVRQNNRTRVFDMKWKTIRGDDQTGNYGLEQADLYQLYAYSQKYAADEVFLVFPANETFREPLPVFRYDTNTGLYVVPFDLTRPLAVEVEKLLSWPLPA